MKHSIEFRILAENSRHLGDVIGLWKGNRSTLGLFPEGAFLEQARQGHLIAAICPDGDTVVGYILFRKPFDRIAITHLCVAEENRGQNIARGLVEFLIRETDDGYRRGIIVRCRHDYEAAPVWHRLDFNAIGEKPGRGKTPSVLVTWWYDYDLEDLFSPHTAHPSHVQRLWVVLDNSVFSCLCEEESDENLESKALEADWLSDSVRLCVTDEIRNEIQRASDSGWRSERYRALNRFHRVEYARREYERIKAQMASHWHGTKSSRDMSDLNQIAKCIAAGVSVFATRDESLIQRCKAFQDEFQLRVLRPVQIIQAFDELKDQTRYQPRRLEGFSFQVVRPQSDDVTLLCEHFQRAAHGESISQLRAKLRNLIAQVRDVRCECISARDDDTPLLLFATRRRSPSIVQIPLFRYVNTSLTRTLAQNYLSRIIHDAGASSPRVLIEYSDFVKDEMMEETLSMLQF